MTPKLLPPALLLALALGPLAGAAPSSLQSGRAAQAAGGGTPAGTPTPAPLVRGDCDGDGIPDAEEPDCDGDGLPDDCEVDANGDGVPDDCALGPSVLERDQPGSLLVYPIFDNLDGAATILSVSEIGLGLGGPPVDVRVVYVGTEDFQGNPIPCEEFDRVERLTANDTLSVLASFHNPQQGRGFVYMYAQDPMSQEPITWNRLIGSVLVLDGLDSYGYELPAMAFQGLSPHGAPTDVDADGIRDLDGVEYVQAPDVVGFPRFIGQSVDTDDELILLNLTGGTQFDATVGLLVFNDNEEPFTVQTTFRCWARRRLLDIAPLFDNTFLRDFTADDPAESLGTRETGWLQIDGIQAVSIADVVVDPAVLAWHVERVLGTAAAQIPFLLGQQANGDLYPVGLVAEP